MVQAVMGYNHPPELVSGPLLRAHVYPQTVILSIQVDQDLLSGLKSKKNNKKTQYKPGFKIIQIV